MNVKRAIIFLILAVCIVTLVSRLIHLQYFKDELHTKHNDNETNNNDNNNFLQNKMNLNDFANQKIPINNDDDDYGTADDSNFNETTINIENTNFTVSKNQSDNDSTSNNYNILKYDRKRRNSSINVEHQHQNTTNYTNRYHQFSSQGNNNKFLVISDNENVSQIDYDKREKVKQVNLFNNIFMWYIGI